MTLQSRHYLVKEHTFFQITTDKIKWPGKRVKHDYGMTEVTVDDSI